MLSRQRRARQIERGLGPNGGGWSIVQAAAWSGIGSRTLRRLVKRKLAEGDASVFPFHIVGRRIILSRQGFVDWFNAGTAREVRS
jgi:hypothetical protein